MDPRNIDQLRFNLMYHMQLPPSELAAISYREQVEIWRQWEEQKKFEEREREKWTRRSE